MDYKRILKNIAFIAFVPSVVVVGYYGYKAVKKYMNEEEEDNNEGRSVNPKLDNTQSLKSKQSLKIVDDTGKQLVMTPPLKEDKNAENK